VTALFAIPLAVLLYGTFHEEHPQLALATAIIGVLSGLVQAFGLFRWVFHVPSLAATYADTVVDPVLRAAATMMFESAHRYLGVAIGEHLGYLFTGVWTILLGVMMLRSRQFPSWLGVLGIVAAIGVMIGMLEPAGWNAAGAINAISYIVWSLWLIVMGVSLVMRNTAPARRNATA
jgi:hypothetical protein